MPTETKTFVVQLARNAGPDRIEGRIESLDSGEIAGFVSARGLLRFLRSTLVTPSSDDATDRKQPESFEE